VDRWRRIAKPPILGAVSELPAISLEPNPVIEAYKKDVDRTLIRENLKLTHDERLRKMIAMLEFIEEIRRSSGMKR